MRVLGLDIGEKRIGVAVSDPTGTVASPLVVLDSARALGDGTGLRALVEEYEPELLVAGLPLSMDGAEGPQAASVRRAGERLAGLVSVPIDYLDERLSSAEAERMMADAGADSRARRGRVDMVAAALILQAYLDARGGSRVGDSSDDAE
jgi:putative Holliday junction resolvase